MNWQISTRITVISPQKINKNNIHLDGTRKIGKKIYKQVERNKAMLTVLESSTIRLAQEAERRRIARELHDSVVQSLTVLVADLEYFQTRQLPTLDQTGDAVAEKVAAWQELACDSLTSMRRALSGLRQPGELDFGLEYSIQLVLSELQEAGYTVVFNCDNWPDQLPRD